MAAKHPLNVDGRVVNLSNLEKVLYPASGFTKAQVIDYYARVSEWILPHLRDRPVTLKRFPDGIGGQAFYEKDAPRFTPEWVAIAPVPRRAGGKDIRYVLINDRPTLVWCANIASLELHPFLHKAGALDKPDALVFDLDPGEGANIITAAKVGFLVRDLLLRAGLKTFPKLSGSRGIQIYAPLNTPVTYAATQPFAHEVARALERDYPDLIVSGMAKNLRANKVFIDWSQNSDFKTTVGVYSLRAKRERPFVSLPVTWTELEEMVSANDPDRFCLSPEEALKRFARQGDLFAPVLTLQQELPGELPANAPAPRFVIQKHAAKQLHYDFRLEMKGALKSWAVPKGVPLESGARRLAMLTEDHPLEYLDFEGTIPEPQYGAGTVMVWDTGTYDLVEGNVHKGKLGLRLRGKKLNGEWTLARRSKDDPKAWFLSKTGDAAAPVAPAAEDASVLTQRSMRQIADDNDAQWHSNRTGIEGLNLDPLPKSGMTFVEPMQAKPVTELPEGLDWQYEIKLDGYRSLAIIEKGGVRLLSRRNNSLDQRFAEISAALENLESGLILDGEVVALDPLGRPSFHLLQNQRLAKHPLVYYVFDIVAYRGRSVAGLPLDLRRRILESVLQGSAGHIRYSARLDAPLRHLLAAVKEQGLEGLIAKRTGSLYEPGKRSGEWMKYKVDQGQELVIGGYKPAASGFENLAVGYYEKGKLQFVGKVRNGFVPATKRELAERFPALAAGECPFANLPEPQNARRGEALTAEAMRKYRWLKPKLVARIDFTAWTRANHLRHSRFVALRDDKKARDVVRESGE